MDLLAHQYSRHVNDLAAPLVAGLGIRADPWGHDQVLHQTPVWLLFRFTVTVLLLGLLMSGFININRFSLHAMYRNHASFAHSARPAYRPNVAFNPFTGFDNLDNPAMSDMRFDDVRITRWFATARSCDNNHPGLGRLPPPIEPDAGCPQPTARTTPARLAAGAGSHTLE
ncbi:MAG: hypothetical protein MRJ92_03235 [Nitrospira sp.]|nr:hypothetical protein [Nitrospira sp.]